MTRELSLLFRTRPNLRQIVGCVVVAAFLSGCASLSGGGESGANPETAEESAQQIFDRATAQLAQGNERTAARIFNEVEQLYPYSDLVPDALLGAANALFEVGDYDEGIIAAQRFLDLYPGNENAAEARYLIAQSYYEQITDVGRDQAITQEALKSLREVVARYPDSPFARDAKLKMDLTFDHLAGKEMDIGRYYLARGHFLAAANRFRTVVTEYQTSTQTPEALHRLVETYLSIGATEQARAAAAVLGHNFPASDWYSDSYALLEGSGVAPGAKDGNWINRIYRQVVEGGWQ